MLPFLFVAADSVFVCFVGDLFAAAELKIDGAGATVADNAAVPSPCADARGNWTAAWAIDGDWLG